MRRQPVHALGIAVAAVVFAATTVTTGGLISGRGHLPSAGPAQAPAPRAVAASIAPLAYAWIDRNPQPDVVSGESGIVVDLGARRILWHKDALSRRAPASLTKIVTAMVAADHAPLNRVVSVPAAAATPNPAWTMMGLDAREKLTVGELMIGMFTLSGNDAAETLAQSLEPRSQFIADMNAKVASLGLTDTHFTNPTGLDARGQYSTAYDLAVLAGWLELRYPSVFALSSRQGLDLPATGGHKAFQAASLNKLLWLYPGATGLKTGATYAAGGCLVGTADRGGRRMIVVDLHSDVFFTDVMTLLDYGYAH